jgi:hypothetical protein
MSGRSPTGRGEPLGAVRHLGQPVEPLADAPRVVRQPVLAYVACDVTRRAHGAAGVTAAASHSPLLAAVPVCGPWACRAARPTSQVEQDVALARRV